MKNIKNEMNEAISSSFKKILSNDNNDIKQNSYT